MEPALKQRLLGAAVLIALAVIFVPMFFPGPASEDQPESMSLEIPEEPAGPVKTRVFELDIPAEGESAAAPSAAGQPSTRPVSPPPLDQRQAEAEPQAEPEAEPRPAQAPPQAEPQATDSASDSTTAAGTAAVTRFAVSLGVFANAANAEARLAQAKLLGYPAQLKAMQVNGESAQGVRVGPFDTRAEAEAARLRLDGKMAQANPSLVALTSSRNKDAPADAIGADEAGSWAVQLAAFRERADAESLRDTVREAGFEAFIDQTRDAGGNWWRVRVGPRAQRADAEALKTKLKQELGQSGLVVAR